MRYDCPRGHASEDADYCSECGLRLEAAGSAPVPANPAGMGDMCPTCATPRVAGARYCEVCRHDFIAAGRGEPAAPSTPAVEAPGPAPAHTVPAGHAAAPEATAFPGRNLWAIVTPDRSLMTAEDDIPFPQDEPVRSYPLDLDENLVGRRNARAGVHPEIAVNDPSVSARHLKICRRPEGALYLVDVGSSNGTRLNGAPVDPGVETALRPGDRVTLGLWTRLVVEAR